MESLVPVFVGGDDVAVGISGFGSARVEPARWADLGRITGRTTYQLGYDAQHTGVPITPMAVAANFSEMRRRWELAHKGADSGARHLSVWIDRWCSSGRGVMVVGFSLGCLVTMKAIHLVPRSLWNRIDVVLVSAAVPDGEDLWAGSESLSSLTNVFSSSDFALGWMYPRAINDYRARAVGSGAIPVVAPNIHNVDLTDLIGADHMWASRNLPRLLRIALGVSWSTKDIELGLSDSGPPVLSEEAICRLSGWTLCVPEVLSDFRLAMSGDRDAILRMKRLDSWSLEGDRISSLLNAGCTVRSLSGVGVSCPSSASRSLLQVEGIVRHWISSRKDRRLDG